MTLYYWNEEANFGDGLAPHLVERIAGRRVEFANPMVADMLSVGSVLSDEWLVFQPDWRHPIFSVKAYFALRNLERTAKRMVVWGSGFLVPPVMNRCRLPIRRLEVRAVRGHLTYEILGKMGLVRRCQKSAYGDPGLLYHRLLCERPRKIHDLAIVPHFVDGVQGREVCKGLIAHGVDAICIDVSNSDPLIPLRQIAECRTVVSSSLHGLIVADSLGIPNARLCLSLLNKNSVDDYLFKFRDYYSAMNMEPPSCLTVDDLFAGHEHLISHIRECYCVNSAQIERIKNELLSCFPFPVAGGLTV